MAAVTTTGAGNWSSGSSVFSGGSGPGGVPSNADTVTISHAITLDTTAAVCSTLTIASGGTLQKDASASGKVVIQTSLTINSGGNLSADMTGSASQTFDIWLNNSRAAAADYFIVADGGSYTLKGYPRKRWTTLTADVAVGATIASVADATGWQTGDRLVFGTTQAYNATPRIDVALGTNTVSGTSLSNLNSYRGGGTTMAYAHATGGLVGNFSSNLTIRAATLGDAWQVQISTASTPTSCTRIMTDVLFDTLNGRLRLNGGFAGRAAAATNYWGAHSNNAIYDNRSAGFNYAALFQPIVRQNNIVYGPSTSGINFGLGSNCGNIGADISCVSFAANGSGGYGFNGSLGYTVESCHAMASNYGGFAVSYLTDCDSYANSYGIYCYSSPINIIGIDSRIGTQFSAAASNATGVYQEALAIVDLEDTYIQASNSNNALTYATSGSRLKLTNKNADVTAQELYLPQGTVKRNNSEVKRSTSSVAIKPSTLGVDTPYTVTIPCANGASVRVVGYCKADTSFYNSGGSGWTAPTVQLSGLGLSAGVTAGSYFTASSAANNAFEQFDISATNSSGADGNFTLTFNANAKSVTTGTVYFDGVPTASPFVTKSRHYGFTFDQTVPNAVVNSSVSASEATALGYSTKFSVTGGASQSDVALTASATFQQLYDYTQAWSCTTANLAYAIPCTSPAGSGNLIAAGDVTATGYTLNGSGSLSMGSNTLTANDAFSYTYTGGTFSQATTVPSFAGGTLTIPTKITTGGDFSMTTATIVFGAAGADWNFSDASYSGTITLATTAGQAVTVSMPTPSGFTINNTEPGNITVTAPVVTANISITNLPVAGSHIRLQIYNMSTDTIIYSGDPAGTSYSDSYIDGVGITAGDTLRVRFVELNAGTSFKFFSMLVDATADGFSVDANNYITADDVYAINATDGSSGTVTAKFSADFSPTNPQINLKTASNFTSAEFYAYWCYLLTDATGIGVFWGGLTAPDPGNIRINNSVVDMYLDNETTATKRQTDSARIYRADGAYPVLDPTTSGYGIDINWKNQVYAYAVSSGITTQDKADIAAATRTELGPELTATIETWRRHGLDIAAPLTQTSTAITAGDIDLAITGDPNVSVTVTRQP